MKYLAWFSYTVGGLGLFLTLLIVPPGVLVFLVLGSGWFVFFVFLGRLIHGKTRQ